MNGVQFKVHRGSEVHVLSKELRTKVRSKMIDHRGFLAIKCEGMVQMSQLKNQPVPLLEL